MDDEKMAELLEAEANADFPYEHKDEKYFRLSLGVCAQHFRNKAAAKSPG